MKKSKTKILIGILSAMILFTACGQTNAETSDSASSQTKQSKEETVIATIEKNDFIGTWKLQGSLSDSIDDTDEETALGLDIVAGALNLFTGTDLNDVTLKITKNGKVITSIAEQNLDTSTYSITDDGTTIYFGDGCEATLNNDKDIMTVYDENGSMDYEKSLD